MSIFGKEHYLFTLINQCDEIMRVLFQKGKDEDQILF
jgi:transposase-like protein